MLNEDAEVRPVRVGRPVDQSTEGPIQQLRLAERAAWQELQRLGERVRTGDLLVATPARAARVDRQREAYRRAQGTWRVARQALDRCL